MNKAQKFTLSVLLVSAILIVSSVLLIVYSDQIAVLNPKGMIALKERNLIIISTLLMLIVVIPVFIMITAFAWRYRASNKKARYEPDWDYSLIAETIWWGGPFIIVCILSVITWISSHELDPFKPIESDKKPLTIQVIALQWKWLFIYPEYNIATVNFFNFPEKTPINFELTADAPMNSFWIPQLSGQIYAMPKMKTLLHLIADEPGLYRGSSANISGVGFAQMHFIAEATPEADFEAWVNQLKQSPNRLGMEEYNQLAKPSLDHPVLSFSLEAQGLFDQVMMKSTMPNASK
jgi:cytochrome o ubiquinol oxidase subunit II